ncbi:hypothetical protein OH77DRAFT_355369 [Trametes cingulata]|nr:hypothetical protein OH77DRAFT_355369 [Trametes cingulata]
MAAFPRLSLPTELLHTIMSLVRHDDLPALALANKLCNEICTPILYQAVDLYDYSAARKCLSTLTSHPSTLSFCRDLACLVRSFRLHTSCHTAEPFTNDPVFDDLLVRSVARMSNLRALECTESRECGLLVLLELLGAERLALKRIEISLVWSSLLPTEDEYERAFLQLVNRRVAMPRLTELHVHAPINLSPSLATVLHRMIASSSETLRKLSVTMGNRTVLPTIVPPLSTWHSLQQLEIYADALQLPGFGHLALVKSLSIIDTVSPPPDGFVVPATHWPVLEELACFPEWVPYFLPPQAETRRPIHTIRLSYALYEHNGGSYSPDNTPLWKDSLHALAHTRYSAVSLKHFIFQVDKLNVERFERMLPYLREVESIAIVIVTCPDAANVQALGARIIARLPHLHTLLLSDTAYKEFGPNKAFKFARDVVLQRAWLAEYARHSSVLRHVAFTTEFEWEKGDDGAWYPTELPKDKPVDVDPEDDQSVDSLEDEWEEMEDFEDLEELEDDSDG